MRYECMYAPKLQGWVVEAVGSDGEVYVAQFYGPDDEERAKEYAAWKNAAASVQPQRQSALRRSAA